MMRLACTWQHQASGEPEHARTIFEHARTIPEHAPHLNTHLQPVVERVVRGVLRAVLVVEADAAETLHHLLAGRQRGGRHKVDGHLDAAAQVPDLQAGSGHARSDQPKTNAKNKRQKQTHLVGAAPRDEDRLVLVLLEAPRLDVVLFGHLLQVGAADHDIDVKDDVRHLPGAGDAFCTLLLSGQLNCTSAHRAARESLPVLAKELADVMRQVSPEHRLALHGPDVPQGAGAAMPTRIAFVNEGPCCGQRLGLGHS